MYVIIHVMTLVRSRDSSRPCGEELVVRLVFNRPFIAQTRRKPFDFRGLSATDVNVNRRLIGQEFFEASSTGPDCVNDN